MLPVVGQIQTFAFNFAPVNWAQCEGQLLPISQYQELFSLIGPTYGGNGETDFALPKLAPLGPEGPAYFICLKGNYPTR